VRVACSVEIDRPAREVWAYVADYGNDTRRRAGVSQLRPSRPGPAQAGVTTHEALRLLGATFRTAANHPSGRRRGPARVASARAAEGPAGVAPGGADGPGGARFTEVVDIRLVGPLRPLGPLVAWLLQRRAAADLRRLKRILEAPAGGGPPQEATATRGRVQSAAIGSDRSAAPRHGGHRCPSGCGSALHEQLSLFGEPLFGELGGMPAR
jgi:Polyketide cyclase / dehydrase and lipid transport